MIQALEKEPLGEGGGHTVYDLPGMDFVVRVPKAQLQSSNVGRFVNTLGAYPLKPYSTHHKGMNVGQPVAVLGDVLFLKRQTGVPAGFKYRGDKEVDEEVLQKNIAGFKERLHWAAAMPQEAYDKLMENIKTLNNRGYKIDPSKPGNLLIDWNGKRFGLVDVAEGDYASGAGDVLMMLMHNFMFSKYLQNDEEAKGYAREIIKKLSKWGLDRKNSGVQYSLKLSGM